MLGRFRFFFRLARFAVALPFRFFSQPRPSREFFHTRRDRSFPLHLPKKPNTPVPTAKPRNTKPKALARLVKNSEAVSLPWLCRRQDQDDKRFGPSQPPARQTLPAGLPVAAQPIVGVIYSVFSTTAPHKLKRRGRVWR